MTDACWARKKRNDQRSNEAGMGATCITQRQKQEIKEQKQAATAKENKSNNAPATRSPPSSVCAISQKSTSITFQLISVNVGYAVTSLTMLITLHASIVAFKYGLSDFFCSFLPLFSTYLPFYLRRGKGRGDVCLREVLRFSLYR